MRLIKIWSMEDDRDYELYFVIPSGMENDTAIKLVDEAVAKAKENEDYVFEDLEAILTPLGFVSPTWVTANERW